MSDILDQIRSSISAGRNCVVSRDHLTPFLYKRLSGEEVMLRSLLGQSEEFASRRTLMELDQKVKTWCKENEIYCCYDPMKDVYMFAPIINNK